MEKGTYRPPIVAVLGHVDHGKTTLLDALRKTNVAKKEAGGITQSIGASVISTKEGKEITFIDTPGHAAFANMRSRGAKVADIAILVIAADDGIKPQSREALEYILQTKIPFIVAATKIDLPSASVDTVKGQLEKEGVLLEGSGGDVPVVPVSGKTGEGLENLLEMVTLVAEVSEVKGNPAADLEAVVIETSKDKRGPVASILVRNGVLSVGDEIVTETVRAKVRGLFDQIGGAIKKVGPGKPAQVLGFDELPTVGCRVWHLTGEVAPAPVKPKALQLEPKEGQTPVVIKAKASGALEALLASLPSGAFVVSSGIGDVNEGDVFSAKSATLSNSEKGSYVFAFECKVPQTVAKLAETEGIKIKTFDVIYEFLRQLEEVTTQEEKEILGKAEIIVTFPYDNQKIAGCKVVLGRIAVGDNLVLMRKEKKLGEAKIISMKKLKQAISQAKAGEDCGVLFSPQLDFSIGDVILSVANQK